MEVSNEKEKMTKKRLSFQNAEYLGSHDNGNINSGLTFAPEYRLARFDELEARRVRRCITPNGQKQSADSQALSIFRRVWRDSLTFFPNHVSFCFVARLEILTTRR